MEDHHLRQAAPERKRQNAFIGSQGTPRRPTSTNNKSTYRVFPGRCGFACVEQLWRREDNVDGLPDNQHMQHDVTTRRKRRENVSCSAEIQRDLQNVIERGQADRAATKVPYKLLYTEGPDLVGRRHTSVLHGTSKTKPGNSGGRQRTGREHNIARHVRSHTAYRNNTRMGSGHGDTYRTYRTDTNSTYPIRCSEQVFIRQWTQCLRKRWEQTDYSHPDPGTVIRPRINKK